MPEKRLARSDAQTILRAVPRENAFYFYQGFDRPILLHARNLSDFVSVLRMVDSGSIAFHLDRGDFQNWISMLGDRTLVDRIDRLRVEGGLAGEELRAGLIKVVRTRMLQLARAAKAKSQPLSVSTYRHER